MKFRDRKQTRGHRRRRDKTEPWMDERARTFIPRCRCGKPCYKKIDAQTAKNKREREGAPALRIYQCPESNAWHLTHVNA